MKVLPNSADQYVIGMDPSSPEALNSFIAKDIIDYASKYKQCDFASVQAGNLKSHSDEILTNATSVSMHLLTQAI